MSDPLSHELLALLRCPATGQNLRPARAEDLRDFEGEFPEGGLVTDDETLAYPIRDGFPVLVNSEVRGRTQGSTS